MVEQAVAGADAAVNAVSLYVERGDLSFASIHVEGARHIARMAARAGIRDLIHLSGIGADPRSTSPYVRARGQGEDAVRDGLPEATIVRPSAMFGVDDGLTATLSWQVRRLPVIPLFGRGGTRLQPVFVRDVADGIGELIERQASRGQTCEFGGPQIYTYRELLDLVMTARGRRRPLLPLPFALWTSIAWLNAALPKPLVTEGQVELMRHDNVAASDRPGLAMLGISPVSLEAVLRGEVLEAETSEARPAIDLQRGEDARNQTRSTAFDSDVPDAE